tara:strand:- start:836 stop:2137 length:1302 start_codon:yes stop_codon:yes gene_type:complete
MNSFSLLRPLLGVVLVFSLFYSCKKKEGPTAGIEIQPGETQLGLFSTDTFEVVCYPQRLDSVRSDGNALTSVGSYQDPIMGTIRNSYVTHVRLSSENIDVNQLRTFRVDSVVLASVYSSYYGDLDAQSFYVYRVTEDLYLDTAYYSNKKVSTDPTPIGKLENYTPNPFAKFTENGEEQPSQLRIRIDSTFGVELFNAPTLAYTSNEEFLKVFKGFYVKTDNPPQPSNSGGQMLLDMEDDYSRLLVYYTTPTGENEILEYLINDKCAKINLSDNDYSGSEVESAFDNPTLGQNKIYVQAMGGVVSILKIPNIKQLNSKGPVIINQAQFIFNIESGTNVRYSPLPRFYTFGIKEDGNIFDTPDRKEIHYGGEISEALEYKLTMTRYYQQVLNGLYEDRGLMLMELGGNYGRSVIGGPKSSTSPLKFVVSYTPINN